MSAPDVPQFLLDHVWAPVMALLTWFAKSKVDSIERTAKDALPRADFDAYKTAATKDRDERRQTELALFDKVDDLRRHVDQKFDTLTTLILNSRKD